MSINYTRGAEVAAMPGALFWGGTKHAGHANWSQTLSPSIIPIGMDYGLENVPIPGPLNNRNVVLPLGFTKTLDPQTRANNVRGALKGPLYSNPLKNQVHLMHILSNQMWSTHPSGENQESEKGLITPPQDFDEYQRANVDLPINYHSVKREEFLRAINESAFEASMNIIKNMPTVAIEAPMSKTADTFTQFPANKTDLPLQNFYNSYRPSPPETIAPRLQGL